MKYDAIIVGSGISGMTTAGVLAREGKRVLLLERHDVYGGLMQSYRRGRLTYPTGVHSLGALDEGQITWRYFDYLGVLDRLDLVRMNPDAFQEFVFPDETYRIPIGHDAFRERMVQYFPAERTAIDRFIADMRESMSQSPFYHLDPSRVFTPMAIHTISLSDYLAGLTQSEALRRVLAASYPLHGIEPKDCPALTHFAVMDSYLQSAYRVDERKRSFAKAFMFRLQELGVEMRKGFEVTEVLSEGRTVKGVLLDTGEEIRSDIVVYTGHPKELVKRCDALRPIFRNRVLDLDDTVAFFTACYSWEGEECPAALSDVFLYNTFDLDEAVTPWLPENPESLGIIYLAALPRPERGCYPVVAISAASYDHWESWSKLETGQRDERYESRKRAASEVLLREIRRRWPVPKAAIRSIDSNTPLTLEDYTLSPGGTGYGIRKSTNTLLKSQVGVRTSVKGLFMAGQSSQLPGILGSMISAVNACTAIVGHDHLLTTIARSTA